MFVAVTVKIIGDGDRPLFSKMILVRAVRTEVFLPSTKRSHLTMMTTAPKRRQLSSNKCVCLKFYQYILFQISRFLHSKIRWNEIKRK